MSGRIRTIKPEWLEDSKMARLNDSDRLLSIALLLVADDHGRGRAEPEFIASRAWAYDPREGVAKARDGLARLSRSGFVTLYKVDEQAYFEIRNWTKHQRVDKPSAPRVPGPDQADSGTCDEFARVSRGSREELAKAREGLGTDLRSPISDLDPDPVPVREANAEPTPRHSRSKPSTAVPADDRIAEWCERWSIPLPSSNREVAKFVDHARAKGRTCRDWSAAWRNWERNAVEFAARDGRAVTADPPTPPRLPPGTGERPKPLPLPPRIVDTGPADNPVLRALGAVKGPQAVGTAQEPVSIGDALAAFITVQSGNGGDGGAR